MEPSCSGSETGFTARKDRCATRMKNLTIICGANDRITIDFDCNINPIGAGGSSLFHSWGGLLEANRVYSLTVGKMYRRGEGSDMGECSGIYTFISYVCIYFILILLKSYTNSLIRLVLM